MARDNQKHVNLYLPIDLYNRVSNSRFDRKHMQLKGLEI